MRLLIFGHHSDTGFGVVTQDLGRRFLAAGIDVRIIATNHRGAPVKGPLAGRVWPDEIIPWGRQVPTLAIAGNLWTALDREDDWTPDAVLVIADMSGLMGYMQSDIPNKVWQTVPVYHYCPIEGDNLNPGWTETWKDIQPIAMSEYGASVMSQFLQRPVPMIYHGVDTDTFRPLAPNDPVKLVKGPITSKESAKRAFGLDPRRKMILRTDRLVQRKFYDRFLQAMSIVFRADPSVDIVIHCRPIDDGLSIYEEIGRLPKEMHPRIRLTGAHDTWTGLPREALVALINAADLYVSTTGGEGFGLTLAEAMACEVPVIVTDWAADKEVVGPGGIAVPPLHDSYGHPVRYHSGYGMDWAVPDPIAFAEPILNLLAKPARRREMGKAGRAHVIKSFSWDRATTQFLSIFEEVDAVAA